MKNVIQKSNLFATYETSEELFKYINSMTGPNESYNMAMGAGLMWNTIAHMLSNEVTLHESEDWRSVKKD
jgi:hypothetical protein|tara:strand:+ start:45 stop:254 length:210 start_codon:yes stop_codon:yes gene_type:complete